jgi:hypothetical protein
LIGLGRLDEAATSLEKVRAIQKDHPAARWLLFGCYLGSMQYQKARHLIPAFFAVCGCASMLVYLIEDCTDPHL